MMKKKTIVLIIILSLVILLSFCNKIVVCNNIDAEYLHILEKDDSIYTKLRYSYVYTIDFEHKSYALADRSQNRFSWFEQKDPDAFEISMFAGEYGYTVPDGYDGVIPYIKGCELDKAGSVVDAYGYEKDGLLFGFVRVYKNTRTLYGNYSIEEIDHSLVFTYSAETNKFNVEHSIDDVVIVAVFDNTVIYWKNKAYYCYNLETQAETYLIDDKAYDSGFVQQSSSGVYFNSEICIIHMIKQTLTKCNEYMYVYDCSKGSFYELTLK